MAKKPTPPAAPVAEATPPLPILPQTGGAWVLVDGELRPETPVEPPVQTPVEGAV
jgi:hypothetical protein